MSNIQNTSNGPYNEIKIRQSKKNDRATSKSYLIKNFKKIKDLYVQQIKEASKTKKALKSS